MKKTLPIILLLFFMLLSCTLILFYSSISTAHKVTKTQLLSDSPVKCLDLIDIKSTDTKINFSTLFDGCIRLEDGLPLTYNDLRVDNTIPYIAYDHVEPKFPLWIDTSPSGKRDIVYDLYFYKGDITWRIASSDGKGVVSPNQYCLKLVKNFCYVEPYQNSKSNLYPNCWRCSFIYTLPGYPDKYWYSDSTFIQRGDMSSSVITNDVVEYEFYDPRIVDHMDGVLKKVILEISVKDEQSLSSNIFISHLTQIN